jgi:hypothetical protein
MVAGLMSDELYSSDNFNTRRAVDTRTIDYEISNASSDHAFQYLQRARAEALNAIDLYAASPRAGNPRHAELFTIAGYSVLILVENFCTGIPLSRISESGVEFGVPLSSAELYDVAISYFDQALAQPNGGAVQQNLARIGKARALLDTEQFTAAAQLVAQVPISFAFQIEYAGGSFYTPNPIFNMNNEEKRISVSLQEGTGNRGLPYGTVAATDPRIRISAQSVASNSGDVPAWLQLKYSTQGADIPLATGIEARLMEAEGLLDKGSSAAYLPTLNTLRATIGLGSLSDPGTPAGRVDQMSLASGLSDNCTRAPRCRHDPPVRRPRGGEGDNRLPFAATLVPFTVSSAAKGTLARVVADACTVDGSLAGSSPTSTHRRESPPPDRWIG